MGLYKKHNGKNVRVVESCIIFSGNSLQRRIAKRKTISKLQSVYQCNIVALPFHGAWDFILIDSEELENA